MENFLDINPVDLQVLLKLVNDNVNATLNCVRVGIIQSFNPTKQTVNLKLTNKMLINFKSLDPSDQPIYKEIDQLLDCPLLLQGGINSGLTFPDIVGSECIVLFADRDIDNWFINGGIQPHASYRMHDFSDGFCLLRPRSLPNIINNYDTENVTIFYGNSVIKIGSFGVQVVGNLSVSGNLSVTGEITASNIVSGDLSVTGEITTSNINTPLINGQPI